MQGNFFNSCYLKAYRSCFKPSSHSVECALARANMKKLLVGHADYTAVLYNSVNYITHRVFGSESSSGSVIPIKKRESKKIYWLLFGFAGPWESSVPDTNSKFVKSPLLSVRFWWYFHSFHENEDGVLLKIRL